MYKHTQIGWIMLILIGIVFAFVAYQRIPQLDWIASLLISGILLICIILFSTLTVIVDDDFIKIRFGLGPIRKSFKLNDIKSCAIVRNKWWYSWGIHWIGKCWLFNVSGLDAVELVMKNEKVYRIGTDEPQKLNEFIQRQLIKFK